MSLRNDFFLKDNDSSKYRCRGFELTQWVSVQPRDGRQYHLNWNHFEIGS